MIVTLQVKDIGIGIGISDTRPVFTCYQVNTRIPSFNLMEAGEEVPPTRGRSNPPTSAAPGAKPLPPVALTLV